MHSVDQLVEAITTKTNLMISTAQAWQRPHVIANRIQELAGAIELAHWRDEMQLENEIEMHVDELYDQLEEEYHGMSILTIALPPEFTELCEHDGIQPEVVLRGFIADLCSLMNWSNNPRADGYSSNGSDERNYAEAYYDRVGYPYINHEP